MPGLYTMHYFSKCITHRPGMVQLTVLATFTGPVNLLRGSSKRHATQQNSGKLSTVLEGLGTSPYRGWKETRPRTLSIFYRETKIVICDTRMIARNHVNSIDGNQAETKIKQAAIQHCDLRKSQPIQNSNNSRCTF